MKSKRKRLNYRHTFRLGFGDDGQTFNICVAMSQPKASVRLDRTEADVIAGKAGIAVACADMKCAERNSKSFPHPVYLAEFTKTRAYFVDKLDKDGQPKHCICYAHDDGEWIVKFDQPGGKKKLIRSGDVERTITLTPPPRWRPRELNRPKGKYNASRTKPMSYGSKKRAIEAGWNFQVAKAGNPAHQRVNG